MHPSLRAKTLVAFVALWVGSSSLACVHAGEGQGKATPGAKLSQLNLGSFIYGAPLDPETLAGKVVVVNIGGG